MAAKPTYQELENRVAALEKEIAGHGLAQKALQETCRQYQSLFDFAATATIVVDEDMTILKANAKCEELTGYKPEEVEGKKKTADFLDGELLERMMVYHFARRIDGQAAPSVYDIELSDRWGKIKNVLVQVSMIPESRQSIVSMIDISAHRRVEISRQSKESGNRSSVPVGSES